MYVIYKSQKDCCKVASTLRVILLTFDSEGSEFSEYVFEVQ